jgi:hypothetical protein
MSSSIAATGRCPADRNEGKKASAMAIDTNGATEERLRAMFQSESLEDLARAQHDLAADDFIQEWPQSGERIRGRDNAKAINDNYGDGTPVSYVGIAELREGKLAHITEYFANPFEAPAWRSRWVERMG